MSTNASVAVVAVKQRAQIWNNAETAGEAGFATVTVENATTAECSPWIVEAHDKVSAHLATGKASRASIVAIVDGISERAPRDAWAVLARFTADVQAMPGLPKSEAYGRMGAWWEGAMDACRARALAKLDPTPEPVPEPEPAPANEPVYQLQTKSGTVLREQTYPDVTWDRGQPVSSEPEPAPEPMPEPVPEPMPEPEPVKPPTTGERQDDAKEAALRELPDYVEDAYANCVWLALEFARLGTKRRADVTARTQDGRDVTAQTTTNKVILSNCDEWRAILASDTKFRIDVRTLAVPTKIKGIHPIPIVSMERAETMLVEYERTRAGLVEELIKAWDGAVLKDRDVLDAGLWDPDDYPTRPEVRKAYRMAATWKDLSGSTRISAAMAQRNAEATRVEAREAAAEIRAALRVLFADVVDGLREALDPGPNGQFRKVRDERITDVMSVVDSLAARDVTGDLQLRDLADRARKLVEGIPDGEVLKSDDALRAKVAGGLDEIRTGIRSLGVAEAPSRKLRSAKRRSKTDAETAE